MFRLLSFVSLALAIASSSLAETTNTSASTGTVALELRWKDLEGKPGRQLFEPSNLNDIVQTGAWIAFEAKGDKVFLGVHVAGKFHSVETPVQEMQSLYLVVGTKVNRETDFRFTTIYNQQRPFGSRGVDASNVYHLLVLNELLDKRELPSSSGAMAVSQKRWRDSFWRTRRLAMNYAAQSDAKSRDYEKVFDVKAKYTFPRLVVASEEWIELKTEKKPSGGGGLFGRGIGVLNSIGDDPAPKNRRFPIYNLDVVSNWITAEGTYAGGFHTARSLWNDLLEGKIIYEATGGHRHVLTASIVFAQMEKNRAERNDRNKAILVGADNLSELERCGKMWDGTREMISSFLKRNPAWKVLVTEKPVMFYEKDKPIYAMHAWYQVHPSSGRMIGKLPNGNHAGMTDEIERLNRQGLDKAQEKAESKAGAGGPRGYFDQLAGVYVSAAGILEGVTLTFCNPVAAELSGQKWEKFLAMHALDHAQKFLEDHADLFDSYGSQLAFWQGAMALTSALGGPDAVKEVGRRAFDGVRKKARKDAEKFADDLQDKVKGEAVKEVEKRVGKQAKEIKNLVEGVANTAEALNKL